MHYNKTAVPHQELIDKNERNRITPWRVYKQLSTFLYQAMLDSDGQFAKTRLEAVKECSSWLAFLECLVNNEHPKKLEKANFCKDRLCDGCQNRRALRCFAVTTRIMHVIRDKHPTHEYIFLTLTVPNVSLEKLGEEIDLMFQSWNRFNSRTEVKKINKGYLRSLEITYNHETNEYHPHFHALIVVPKSYFRGKTYIKHERWQQLWKESRRLEKDPSVDIRKVKGKLTPEEKEAGIDALVKACAEICKYSLKSWSSKARVSSSWLEKVGKDISYGMPGHVWLRGTAEETAKTVGLLHNVMKGRRLMQYGGLMRDIKRDLKLQDGEDEGADLINTNDESTGCQCSVCGGVMEEKQYWWDNLSRKYYFRELRCG